MKTVNNPHDAFFEKIFGKKENAKEFLINYLPENILKLIDTDQLEIAKGSFIEKNLQRYFSDLLYKINFKNEKGYIYALFEHKSSPVRSTQLQLLQYMVQIWRQYNDQHPQLQLPIILPLVVYHGKKPWNIGMKFSDLMVKGSVAFNEYIPDFTYILYDLAKYRNSEIKGSINVKASLLLMKNIFNPELRVELDKIFSIIKDIKDKKKIVSILETIITYIMSATELSVEELKESVEKGISKKLGEEIMTTAEKLIEQGVAQGVLKKGRGDIVALLKTRFGKAPQYMVNRINKLDINQLDNLFYEAIKVENLNEFKMKIQNI